MSERQKLYSSPVDKEAAEKQGKRHHLAGDVYYQHPEPDELHPHRYLSLSNERDSIPLSKEQALALLPILLGDLPRLMEQLDLDDALIEDELRELHLL